jgi:hypothetical protein
MPDWPFCDMMHGFVDYHQFPVISTVFLLRWAKVLGEENEGCQEFCTRCYSTAPVVDVEVSVMRASGADELGVC